MGDIVSDTCKWSIWKKRTLKVIGRFCKVGKHLSDILIFGEITISRIFLPLCNIVQ
jgi:hypothetical protein